MCDLNPGYGRGRANKWVNGFGICSVRPSGDFNLFPIVISDGQYTASATSARLNQPKNRPIGLPPMGEDLITE
jgi:hypothetical protein